MSIRDFAGVALAGTAGAVAGTAAVHIAGYSAAGMVGGGAGIGAAAGPVGATFGALAGLSLYGLTLTVKAVHDAAVPATEEEQ